jgi:hypothetical protein
MSVREPALLAGTFFQWITWHPSDAAAQSVPAPPAPTELMVERLSARRFGEGRPAIPPGTVDVEVSFFDTTDGIYASGVYRADRFTSNTMARFMGDLQSAAEQFVRNPHAPVPAVSVTGVPLANG